jgi:hypothetical protein
MRVGKEKKKDVAKQSRFGLSSIEGDEQGTRVPLHRRSLFFLRRGAALGKNSRLALLLRKKEDGKR